MSYTTITAAQVGLADGDQAPQPLDGTIRITPRFPAASTPSGFIATGPIIVRVTGGAMARTDVPAQEDATAQVEFHLHDREAGPVQFPNTEIPLEPNTTINLRDYLPLGVDPATGGLLVRGPRGRGIISVSGSSGNIVIHWEGGGDPATVPMPNAIEGPRGSKGDKGDSGDVRFEGIDPGITVGAREVVIGDQTIRTRAIDPIREGEDGQWRIMDSHGSVALEVDAQGRTHIHDPQLGGKPTTLHVFVAVGQSNMSGRGRPVEAPTSPRVMQYGANRRVIEPAPVVLDMVDTPSGTSPASFFAHNYLASQPSHVGVLLVPAARGGTAFAGSPDAPAPGWTWTKGAAPSPEFALYERSVEQALDAISAARAEGYHTILKGVLWHQGEGNGGITTYAERFDPLVESYRADLDHPTLPVMVGQMCPEGMEDTPSKYNVDAAHQDTPYRVPFTGFAPATWNGHNEGDTTHFSTIGTAHLGDTYVTAYTQAVGNTRRI